MTDTTTTTTEPETTEATPTSPPEEKPTGHGEAAKWRKKLREEESGHAETRAERDALRDRVDVLHRGEVERLLGNRLADVADFWSGTNVADLRDEDGDVDERKVTDAVEALLRAKPHFAARAPESSPPNHQGARRGDSEPPRGPSFGEAVKGTRR